MCTCRDLCVFVQRLHHAILCTYTPRAATYTRKSAARMKVNETAPPFTWQACVFRILPPFTKRESLQLVRSSELIVLGLIGMLQTTKILTARTRCEIGVAAILHRVCEAEPHDSGRWEGLSGPLRWEHIEWLALEIPRMTSNGQEEHTTRPLGSFSTSCTWIPRRNNATGCAWCPILHLVRYSRSVPCSARVHRGQRVGMARNSAMRSCDSRGYTSPYLSRVARGSLQHLQSIQIQRAKLVR